MTEDTFDDIVAGFYRAASGDIGWKEALLAFQRAISAFTVYLHAVDVAQGSVTFSYDASDLPAEAEFDYIRTYHRIDPRANLVMALQQGEWMNCWEHFDDDFVARDSFYQDFLIPYGGRYASGVKLLQDDTTIVMLGVHRGHGSPRLNAVEVATCRRLARHLTDALVMHCDNVKQQQQSRLGMELLARLRAPVALLDEQRRLRHANPAARELLAKGDVAIERGGRIYCRRQKDDSALLVGLLQLLRDDGARLAGAAVDKLFLRASALAGDSTLGLYLYALRPKDTLRAFGDQPLVMLLFHEPGAHLQLDPFVVAAAFDLTPAEARVAVAAAHGAAPDEIARQHAVSTHTVRSQLGAIFQKTGTTRQAELVSLLASLPMAALGLGDA